MPTSPSASTPVDTTKVGNRREVHLETLDEFSREVDRLANQPTRVLGNWTLGQIFEHLARGLEAAVDGLDYRPPLWMRVTGPALKFVILKTSMRPGMKLPDQAAVHFRPGDATTTEEGRARLQAVIGRCQATEERPRHPIFGKWTAAQANKFNLMHAELHLSFVIPEDSEN
ncbi:MAG: DUF1569 domain-containing protein [Rubinisphaera brasiliensis]|uniref:DUF1569 domain-containing protein n=1 Tax=Rubinisphaera brasiliensis TaxID=119 RepID=UPI00391B5684